MKRALSLLLLVCPSTLCAQVMMPQGPPQFERLGITRLFLGSPIADFVLPVERVWVEAVDILDRDTQAFRFTEIDFVATQLLTDACGDMELITCINNFGDTLPGDPLHTRESVVVSTIDVMADRVETDITIPPEWGIGPWRVEAMLTDGTNVDYSEPYYFLPEPNSLTLVFGLLGLLGWRARGSTAYLRGLDY